MKLADEHLEKVAPLVTRIVLTMPEEIARHADVNRLVCDEPNYGSILSAQLCPLRDITLSAATDGPDAACNALSFAVGFDAVTTSIGGARTREAGACAPATFTGRTDTGR